MIFQDLAFFPHTNASDNTEYRFRAKRYRVIYGRFCSLYSKQKGYQRMGSGRNLWEP
ncbi:MAG: hypothetical protein ACYCSO_07020 [Cuniculiplasma sp.]